MASPASIESSQCTPDPVLNRNVCRGVCYRSLSLYVFSGTLLRLKRKVDGEITAPPMFSTSTHVYVGSYKGIMNSFNLYAAQTIGPPMVPTYMVEFSGNLSTVLHVEDLTPSFPTVGCSTSRIRVQFPPVAGMKVARGRSIHMAVGVKLMLCMSKGQRITCHGLVMASYLGCRGGMLETWAVKKGKGSMDLSYAYSCPNDSASYSNMGTHLIRTICSEAGQALEIDLGNTDISVEPIEAATTCTAQPDCSIPPP